MSADPSTGAGLRIAFFVTSYGSGDQLLRLVQTLRRAEPDSPVVVHHDPQGFALDPRRFDGVGEVHLLTSAGPVTWGDLSLELARWRVFDWILRHLDVDWVILLSEQDYPIAPLTELRRRIATAGADVLMAGGPVDQLPPALRRECDKRYRYQYRPLGSTGLERRWPAAIQRVSRRLRWTAFEAVSRLQPYLRCYRTPAALGQPSRIGRRPRHSIFRSDFVCWYGDCWFSASTTALRHVVAYVADHPDFVRWYERTVIPLESATATILGNDPDLIVADVSLHAIRWSDPTSGRPDVLGTADLADLAGRRAAGAVFARKFDAADGAVLDALDRVVFNGLDRMAELDRVAELEVVR